MDRMLVCRQAMLLALLAATPVSNSRAEVADAEAEQLGKSLTSVGAERAGSADGLVPEFTGGLAPPAAWKPGEGMRSDPFAAEQPLRVVTPDNAAASAALLTEGTRVLLEKHADFRIEVYPSHRTVGYPAWLAENTRRNATSARASDSGRRIHDVRPGVPFPIPKDGIEVMWNHRFRFLGRALHFKYDSWLVDSNGQKLLTSTATSTWEFPTFDAKRDTVVDGHEPIFEWRVEYSAPQRRAGEGLLMIDAVDPLDQPRRAWVYLPGQRRVRQVELPDDALHSSSSGTYTNDDAFVYTGILERFDVKLLGKREMIVPYNTYRLTYHENPEETLGEHFVNPGLLRWEVHRVWVVEATLRTDQHHLYGRRVFYLDEDSWTALAADEYDLTGKLVRTVFALPTWSWDAEAPFPINHVAYDFTTGNYFLAFLPGPHGGVHYVKPLPASQWSPDSIAGSGVR